MPLLHPSLDHRAKFDIFIENVNFTLDRVEELYQRRQAIRANQPLLTPAQVEQLATPNQNCFQPAGLELEDTSSDEAASWWGGQESVTPAMFATASDVFVSERSLGIGEEMSDIDLFNDICQGMHH